MRVSFTRRVGGSGGVGGAGGVGDVQVGVTVLSVTYVVNPINIQTGVRGKGKGVGAQYCGW